jgi:hypothetical protein
MRVTHAKPASRRFEFVEERSSKFWEVLRGRKRRCRSLWPDRHGRSVGPKTAEGGARRRAAADGLIREKPGKGYIEAAR